jgi:hypothetical protein
MTTLLIITGPQGAGNHLFSKLFSLHSDVVGWEELQHEYWIPHDQEPFAEYWRNPEKLADFDFSSSQYWVTSISCPYVDDGITKIPKYEEVITAAKRVGVNVKVLVIGRDETILQYQQKRVRGAVSLQKIYPALKTLNKYSPVFASQELLLLYQESYLSSLSTQLTFPIAICHPMMHDLLSDNANKKYITQPPDQPLDEITRKVSKNKSREKSTFKKLLTTIFCGEHESDECYELAALAAKR